MALSFCAIDFETANSFRGSPCSVGLVKVVDGQVVASQQYLIRPPAEYHDFDDFNVRLHGITPEMVRHEPRFGSRLPDIVDFADGLPFVAHNAAFDMGVMRDACLASHKAWPDADYACTLVLSRLTWSLLSYSLPWVAEAAGAPLAHHHDAQADAGAAAAVALAIAVRAIADMRCPSQKGRRHRQLIGKHGRRKFERHPKGGPFGAAAVDAEEVEPGNEYVTRCAACEWDDLPTSAERHWERPRSSSADGVHDLANRPRLDPVPTLELRGQLNRPSIPSRYGWTTDDGVEVTVADRVIIVRWPGADDRPDQWGLMQAQGL